MEEQDIAKEIIKQQRGSVILLEAYEAIERDEAEKTEDATMKSQRIVNADSYMEQAEKNRLIISKIVEKYGIR